MASVANEHAVSKTLVRPSDGLCRGRDLPAQRQKEIEEAAASNGMHLHQALSLRRQLLRAQPGGMHKFSTSGAMGSQQGQQNVADIFESCVFDALRTKHISFKTEAELIEEMKNGSRPRAPTPDIVFLEATTVLTAHGPQDIGWLDCKNFYGSAMLAQSSKIPAGKLPSQAQRYSSVYGRGGFVFAQGFCADLQQHLPDAVLLDAVPVVDLSPLEAVHNEEASKTSTCAQCHESRTMLYQDSTDGLLYCTSCWVAHYGTQPSKRRLVNM